MTRIADNWMLMITRKCNIEYHIRNKCQYAVSISNNNSLLSLQLIFESVTVIVH